MKSILNGEIHVMNNFMMGPNCIIYTKNHCFACSDIPMNKQGEIQERPVIIDDDVWIGSNVIVLPGVMIRKHCIVGVGSVVTKSILEKAIVSGNLARIIRFR